MAKYDKSYPGYTTFLDSSELDNYKKELTETGAIKGVGCPIGDSDIDSTWLYVSATPEDENVEFLMQLEDSPRMAVQKCLIPKSKFLKMTPDEYEEYYNSITIPFCEQVERDRIAEEQKAQNR